MLVVLGISVILATSGFLSLWNLRKHQQLLLASESMVAFLRDAQSRSATQEGGLGWGVHFENSADRDAYWLFSGSVTEVAIERVTLPATVEMDTATDNVFFSKVSGLPDSATTVKIKLLGDDSSIRTITINAQGTIEQN
ncbi:MAG: hypothetical protein G01um101419_257 [Parcubacteria group bacterium Gr01-1014_19]|nr:MAG: hypothetical protein G01um101419_257 [Parcubacteria group bacterium Gr01-1014_19]